MFDFLTNKTTAPSVVTSMNAKTVADPHPLDLMTGGAFSAPTAGDRAAKIREWLTTNPSMDQMQEVFKELGTRDKGAVKPLREKLDEIKRAKGQEVIASEWTDKAMTLLALSKLNIADAMAWQRDAAKAGAPLSKEPLASVKVKLADRVKSIEDLQRQTQVQREAAVLLAQRIEVLSTKPFKEAVNVLSALQTDVLHWQEQAKEIINDSNWSSVDSKFAPLLDSSKAQLLVVWDAFQAALQQTQKAESDPSAQLPPVPVWADEIRALRGLAVVEDAPKKPSKPKIDPEIRLQANNHVREALLKLEQEVGEGHGKASSNAANALRHALKEHGKLIDDKLENQAHAALAAAGELEGWQRWRADQIREELLIKAEGLLKRPEGQALGGRKMQETLRTLREQWKLTDQGGPANHALWKRFDDACNAAHVVVEAWIEKVKTENAMHRESRLALIAQINSWAVNEAAQMAAKADWKSLQRGLNQYADQWQNLGHVSEKTFSELQPQYKAAMDIAYLPLQTAQKQSVERREAMITEAKALGAQPVMRIDAVKNLQHNWQHEAQAVPLDRKFEQKLWDAFRKPIDDAFKRKSAEREKAAAAMGEHDKRVMDASKALQAANASGDGQRIHLAIAALEAAIKGQTAAKVIEHAAQAEENASNKAVDGINSAYSAIKNIANTESDGVASVIDSGESSSPAQTAEAQEQADVEADALSDALPVETIVAEETPAAPVKAAPKKVVAVRGDDRPGMKKSEPMTNGRGGKYGDRKSGDRPDSRGPRSDSRPDARGDRGSQFAGRDDRRGDRPNRPTFEDRGPRLGDAAFRAQKDALESAQQALKKLAMHAHGEVLVQLVDAWKNRDASKVPSGQELGKQLNNQARAAWANAIANTNPGRGKEEEASTSLLRLEMAAEVPTPAEHIAARRMLQLQLLTKRNDPAPAQTWLQDATCVFASEFDESTSRRMQNVLKVLLKR
ncbi:MAG TPA: DUF349 domain-containing protein [Burkholderiaceae bacterium]|nr:DUF349 domain-containing protein [Burkholderiaceae bacterium]